MSNVIVTSFENFPSELFIEIFCYLNGFDIYKAFYGLNHRLSRLVLTYGIKYIDLREIKLYEIQKILSDINCSKVDTLKLSNKYNDEQIDRILEEKHFSLVRSPHLRSLTLDSIGLFTFNSIRSQHFDLCHLQSLTIQFRSGLCHEKLILMYQFILEELCFHFQSLKFLDVSISNVDELIIDTVSKLPVRLIRNSSSLKSLSIRNIRHNNIENVLSQFPNLYKLTATVQLKNAETDYSLLSNLTYCTLTIHSLRSPAIDYFFKQCPNLKQLILAIDRPILYEPFDSYQLEYLIRNYLLKLKQFQVNLTMKYTSSDIMHAFLDVFSQNQFWLERKTNVRMINEKSMINEGFQAQFVIEFSI